MLELAILGLLQEAPMHGYELRKELSTKLGALRAAISYGTLYPTLKRLHAAGWISETVPAEGMIPPLTTRRGRIVYKITAEGKERFADLLAEVGPDAFEDEGFGARLAFFAQTRADIRLQILEGRRRRVEEQRADLAAASRSTDTAGRRFDRYTRMLHEHGLESVDREVRWLSELIEQERNTTTKEEP
jgi:DNA-binding PadR family transcriptional regulator